MPQIVILPNVQLCPDGAVIEAATGESICEALLRSEVEIEHACEISCACTTCHVIVREGYDSLPEADELEDDYLDMAWGLEPDSRLSCQAAVAARWATFCAPSLFIIQSWTVHVSWLDQSSCPSGAFALMVFSPEWRHASPKGQVRRKFPKLLLHRLGQD